MAAVLTSLDRGGTCRFTVLALIPARCHPPPFSPPHITSKKLLGQSPRCSIQTCQNYQLWCTMPHITQPLGAPVFWNHKALRRCEELEDQLRKVKRDFLELQLEWTNAYDKLKTMMGRVAKRADVVRSAAEEPAEEGAGTAFTVSELQALSHLPPHQRRIQEQILLRRRKLGHENGG
jgi:hypothetical protein